MISVTEILEIPVNQIEPSIYNTRYFDPENIEELAASIKSQGQLEAIGVRPHPSKHGFYQVIYGHRRLQAMKNLGCNTIRAEVKMTNDSDMLQMAIVENLQRQDISDYEKGLLFRNMSEQFGMSYEDIGRVIGKSKQLVSNHIAMTRLFSLDDLRSDHDLRICMQKITEGLARVLARVPTVSERRRLLKLAVKEDFCTRELKSLVGRPRDASRGNELQGIAWVGENIRNNSDNSTQLKSKNRRVCVIRVESLNFLISQLKISPYNAGAEIARGASQILLDKGIDPLLPQNWSKVLIEKSKYAGWGKMSTTTDSKLVVHEPTLNPEFLRGYLETLLGIGLKCLINNSKLQLFEIENPSVDVRMKQLYARGQVPFRK